jgi:hypothetical protein
MPVVTDSDTDIDYEFSANNYETINKILLYSSSVRRITFYRPFDNASTKLSTRLRVTLTL